MVLVDLISALFCLTARRRITPSTSRAVLLHLILFFEHIFLGRCLEFLGISFLFFCNPSNDWRRWLAFGKWYLGLAPTSGSAVVDGLLFSRFLMDMGLKQIYDGSLKSDYWQVKLRRALPGVPAMERPHYPHLEKGDMQLLNVWRVRVDVRVIISLNSFRSTLCGLIGFYFFLLRATLPVDGLQVQVYGNSPSKLRDLRLVYDEISSCHPPRFSFLLLFGPFSPISVFSLASISSLLSFFASAQWRKSAHTRIIVLARLEAFLPELKRANEILDTTKANIESEEADAEDDSEEDEDMQGHKDRRHQRDCEQPPYINMVRIDITSTVFWALRLYGWRARFYSFSPFGPLFFPSLMGT